MNAKTNLTENQILIRDVVYTIYPKKNHRIKILIMQVREGEDIISFKDVPEKHKIELKRFINKTIK